MHNTNSTPTAEKRDTLVINLCGAPGAGKSTAAAELFGVMKRNFISVELVTEYAKDLIYSESEHRLKDQLFVFAEQNHRIARLMGKVDFIVTDSPLFLSPFYMPKDYPKEFYDFALVMATRYPSRNIFLERNHPYDQTGRMQTEEESLRISAQLEAMMQEHGITYVKTVASSDTPQRIYDRIILPELAEMQANRERRAQTAETRPSRLRMVG